MKKRRRKSKAIVNGWVPDQHGSWAMGFFPLIIGMIINEKTPLFTLLAIAWSAGFFLFSVAEKWLKYRFKPRYRPALITYASVSGVATVMLIILQPGLLWWAPLFLPLVAISAHRAWARREREMISRSVAIVASSLMIPVTATVASGEPWFAKGAVSTQSWTMMALLATYFISTVPYVKTLIRERNSRPWFIGSSIMHISIVLCVAIAAIYGLVSWAHVAVWTIIAGRAIAMPLIATKRGKPWKPKAIGWPEVLLSLIVLATLPW
ncbi:MAG: YwiC-like family protein [Actinomycetaceae bacterium]|nr:YwiC-like family protein [Actinomycetaceae bacterium]